MRHYKKVLARDEALFLRQFLPGVARSRGFLQALIPLATAAISAYSANKQKKAAASNQVQPYMTDDRSPERTQLDEFLANFVGKFGGQYEPMKQFSGKFTAPLAPLERQGLEQFLPQFLNQPDVSGNTQDARNLLNKTVNGGFDPNTSDAYRAFRNESEYNRKRAINQSRAGMGARGKYFSSEAIREEGDINAQTSNALQTILAELSDKERTRSLQAVAPSLALEESIQNRPLQKAEAATTMGSTPRILEQADLEAVYQDFLRRQDEGANVVSAARGVSAGSVNPHEEYPAPSLQRPTSSSSSDFIQKLVAQFLPSILSSFGGK